MLVPVGVVRVTGRREKAEIELAGVTKPTVLVLPFSTGGVSVSWVARYIEPPRTAEASLVPSPEEVMDIQYLVPAEVCSVQVTPESPLV